MPNEDLGPSIVIHHGSAAVFGEMLREAFPELRVIEAPDVETLEANIGDAHVILAYRFPVELIKRARKLRWFQCTAAGVDFLLPVHDQVHHVTVTNARGIHGGLIADYVMASVTMLQWDFKGFLRDQAEKKWELRPITPLSEKTIGIVGLGSIGSAIACRAKCAGMTVLGSKRNNVVPVEGVDEVFKSDALGDMLPRCDFVVLALPATPDTVGFIGADEIVKIRSDAYLINIARGSVVDEPELIKALQDGAIAGAMLDVFQKEPLPQDSPFWTMPNVIVTPHVAGFPTDLETRAFGIFAENLKLFMADKPLQNVVDLKRGY